MAHTATGFSALHRRCAFTAFAGALLLSTIGASAGRCSDLGISAAIPNGFGVNIHFTNPQPGELEMIRIAGFGWVRMDFVWASIEREKGKYDFSAYDTLLKALDQAKIRPLFILDYGNPLYDDGRSPATEVARDAFCAWVAAAMKRYRGRGILWEMWNEPNIGFWKPKPDADAYATLALAVGKTIRETAPSERYIGPASSEIDLAFLESCFKVGLLEYWSAVSVHPYRQSDPETVTGDYAKLRTLIATYAPAGKSIPILSGEWGYSAVWSGYDEARQARCLTRELLTNVADGIPLSIWYDWHDDGTDPKDPEHHFGTVQYARQSAPGDPVYPPKPAYLAMRTLSGALRGYTFEKRLDAGDNIYLLQFSNRRKRRIVAWTTSSQPATAAIPLPPGAKATVIGMMGESAAPLAADGSGSASLSLTDAPVYIEW